MRTRWKLIIWLALPATLAVGRVFERWKGIDNVTSALQRVHGRVIYDSAVSINNGPGHLIIYGFKDNSRNVARTLRSLFGRDAFPDEPGDLSTGKKDIRNLTVRFVMLSGTGTDKNHTLLFVIEQTRAAYARSLEYPRQTIPGIPVFPGSEIRWQVMDHCSDTLFAAGRLKGDPETLYTFYAQRLMADGWKIITPAAGGHSAAGLLCFKRKNRICLIFAASSPSVGRPGTFGLLLKNLQ